MTDGEPVAVWADSRHPSRGSEALSWCALEPLDLLLDQAPVAICLREILGDDLLHPCDSAHAAALLGRTRAEVEGRTDLELGVAPARISWPSSRGSSGSAT